MLLAASLQAAAVAAGEQWCAACTCIVVRCCRTHAESCSRLLAANR
jgi:hypothetical protein